VLTAGPGCGRRGSSVSGCLFDCVGHQFSVVAVQAGECVTQVDGDSGGQACGEAEHAAFGAGAGQFALLKGGDRFGPVDGRYRGSVARAGGGVHEVLEEVASPQPGGVADQELDGRFEAVQALGVRA